MCIYLHSCPIMEYTKSEKNNGLPSCLPSGGCLTHQHIASELICLFSDSRHLPNTVFTIFLFKCSDCTLRRSGTASLTIGARNLQEENAPTENRVSR